MALKVLLATRNRGKIVEIEAILDGAPVEIVSAETVPPWPEPAETGESFLENALIKARAAFEATGIAALADDSGLEVDALGGEPGVTSARYGGDGLGDAERGARLLEALEGVPGPERTARFRCVMVLYPAPGRPGRALVTEGLLEGRIAPAPAGSNGFGYDPVFVPEGADRTLAEMGAPQKNAISHRYRALEEMRGLLEGGPAGAE